MIQYLHYEDLLLIKNVKKQLQWSIKAIFIDYKLYKHYYIGIILNKSFTLIVDNCMTKDNNKVSAVFKIQ